jgi:glycosyltransferase involved in cell wall biosynthesis
MDAQLVLITSAHNEAAFIDRTCRSILAQRLKPARWIIVDDASSDDTGSIVSRYRDAHPDLIELIRRDRPHGRDFTHKARAFALGLERARQIGFRFIGNVDADITLGEDYYQRMAQAFDADERLGIVGGMVASSIGGAYVRQEVALDSVAGAVQLFRAECFDAIGGYMPLPHGGLDAAAEIRARMLGWRVRTIPDIVVMEHRRTGSATAHPMKARLREGRRMYALGYAPGFFAARCIRRVHEAPAFIGSLGALLGYALAAVRREPRALPPDVVRYLRAEQRVKLTSLFRRARSSTET